MMKVLIIGLMSLHGLIHLIGFTKAFNFAPVPQLTQAVSKPNGILWLVATLLFTASSLFLFLKNEAWWIVAIIAIFISQYLIITTWHDARWGTVANVIILAAVIFTHGTL